MTRPADPRMRDVARSLAELDLLYPRCDVHTWAGAPPEARFHVELDSGQIYLAGHLTGDQAFAAIIDAAEQLRAERPVADVIPMRRNA